MYFKPYYLGCLAHASYLIGGDNGEAIVIDPRRDVEEYLQDAAAANLKITHIIETHFHADFVSGHLELANRTGATIYLGEKADPEFPCHLVRDDEEVQVGDVRLKFLATPGHTPEGVSILLTVVGEPTPRMVFTGDTLFIGDVGRPDLVGSKGFTAEEMAHQMFASLRDKLLSLPDSVEVWPAHGAGSACGRHLSSEKVSSIGKERRENPALSYVLQNDEAGFVQYATEGLGAAPTYFFHDAQKNRTGAGELQEILNLARPLIPTEVRALAKQGALVLDTRAMDAFALGHIPGALHVQLEGKFAPWVGEVLSPQSEIVVVAEIGHEVETMIRLARVGYERIVGWLNGGLAAWTRDANALQDYALLSAEELEAERKSPNPPRILDVRSANEWEAGAFPEAQNVPVSECCRRLSEIPEEPLLVVCGTGYRASIAASILQRAGRSGIRVLRGGMEAWSALQAERRETSHVAV